MKSSRQLCQSSNKKFLLVFADFVLKEFNVKLTVEHFFDGTSGCDSFRLLLANKDIYLEPEITSAFNKYAQNPNHPQYIQASWNVGNSDAHISQFSLQNGLLSSLKENAMPITTSIILLALSIYLLMFFFSPSIEKALYYPSSSEQYTEVWRFFSHAFLHFSLLHLLVNSMWIWYLGLQVEKQLGCIKLLVIFFIAVLLTGYGQNAASGHTFGGLSGAVYALTGFCWLYGILMPKKGLFLPSAILIFSVVWIVVGFSNFLSMNIGNEAHFIGLIVGLVFALIDYTLVKIRSKN